MVKTYVMPRSTRSIRSMGYDPVNPIPVRNTRVENRLYYIANTSQSSDSTIWYYKRTLPALSNIHAAGKTLKTMRYSQSYLHPRPRTLKQLSDDHDLTVDGSIPLGFADRDRIVYTNSEKGVYDINGQIFI